MSEMLRCDAAEIREVLVQAAQPKSRTVLRKRFNGFQEAVTLITASLWKVELWWAKDGLVSTVGAVSPDGRTWDYGCQRRWTEDGSVIDPLLLLSEEQRQMLEARIRCAVSLPVFEDAEPIGPVIDRVKAKEKPEYVKRGRKRNG
jgi:hypothetical protein